MLNKYRSITGRKIRFALVGVGRIALNHINALKEFPSECELVALCDVDDSKLKAILDAQKNALENNITYYTNLVDMLNAGGFDVVIIATPSGLHSRQTQMCAEAGYHVISECKL